MAYEESLKSVSLDADSSLATYTGVPQTPGAADPNSGHQYKFVKVTGRHQVGLATAATNELVVGVLQNKPQVTGQAATVAISGITLVRASAALAAGDGVKVSADGRAAKATPGTDVSIGVVITPAAGADKLASVLLRVN